MAGEYFKPRRHSRSHLPPTTKGQACRAHCSGGIVSGSLPNTLAPTVGQVAEAGPQGTKTLPRGLDKTPEQAGHNQLYRPDLRVPVLDATPSHQRRWRRRWGFACPVAYSKEWPQILLLGLLRIETTGGPIAPARGCGFQKPTTVLSSRQK